MDAKAIANGTIAALEAGQYTAPDGTSVAIRDLLAACVGETSYYEPEELDAIRERVLAHSGIIADDIRGRERDDVARVRPAGRQRRVSADRRLELRLGQKPRRRLPEGRACPGGKSRPQFGALFQPAPVPAILRVSPRPGYHPLL